MLSLPSSVLHPDPPVSKTLADFPGSLVIQRVFARRPGLGCLRDLPCFGSVVLPCVPLPMRREENWGTKLQKSPQFLMAFPRSGTGRLLRNSDTGLRVGAGSRRCRIRFMLRPAWLFALLCRSDLELFAPAAEDFYFRAFPREVTHPLSRV